MGTQTHLSPNFSFSLDFVHFLKCWKIENRNSIKKKIGKYKILKFPHFWGDVPR